MTHIGTVLSTALAIPSASIIEDIDLEKKRLYQITNESLGKGAYGTVTQALKVETGSPLIVKAQQNGPIAKIEGEMLSLLKDVPHIVHCRDVFLGLPKEDPKDQKHYIMMNQASGKDLVSFFRAKNPADKLTFDENVTIARQLLEVLKALSDRNIVHFDLKSLNIFFDRKSRILTLIDFGGARNINELHINPTTTASNRAPEFLLEKPVGPAYDLWSLGCLLYFLLTDKVLFPITDSIPKDQRTNLLLQMIDFQLGKPSREYLSNSPIAAQFFDTNLEFRSKVDLPAMRKWQEVVREAGAKKGIPAAEVELFVGLMGSLLRYENRASVEELLTNPLFQREIGVHLTYEPRAKCKMYIVRLMEEKELSQLESNIKLEKADLEIDFHTSVDPHLHLPRSPLNKYLIVLVRDQTFMTAIASIEEGGNLDICEMQRALVKKTTKCVRTLFDESYEEVTPAPVLKKSRQQKRSAVEPPAAAEPPRYSLRSYKHKQTPPKIDK